MKSAVLGGLRAWRGYEHTPTQEPYMDPAGDSSGTFTTRGKREKRATRDLASCHKKFGRSSATSAVDPEKCC